MTPAQHGTILCPAEERIQQASCARNCLSSAVIAVVGSPILYNFFNNREKHIVQLPLRTLPAEIGAAHSLVSLTPCS